MIHHHAYRRARRWFLLTVSNRVSGITSLLQAVIRRGHSLPANDPCAAARHVPTTAERGNCLLMLRAFQIPRHRITTHKSVHEQTGEPRG